VFVCKRSDTIPCTIWGVQDLPVCDFPFPLFEQRALSVGVTRNAGGVGLPLLRDSVPHPTVRFSAWLDNPAAWERETKKLTDVNIAIQLFEAAIKDRFDTAMIVSGDSDLIPSIEAVKSAFPAKRIGVVIPIGRRAEALKNSCDFHIKMKEKHLRTSQFPEEIDLGDDKKLVRPSSWR